MISQYIKGFMVLLLILFLIIEVPYLINDLPAYISSEYVRTAIFLMILAVIIFFIMIVILRFD